MEENSGWGIRFRTAAVWSTLKCPMPNSESTQNTIGPKLKAPPCQNALNLILISACWGVRVRMVSCSFLGLASSHLFLLLLPPPPYLLQNLSEV